MTDTSKSEDQTPVVAAQAAPAAPSTTPEPQVVHKGGGKGLGIVAILLSLLALGAAGFTLYQTQLLGGQKESRLSVGIGEIGSQVTLLGDRMARLQQDQSAVVTQEALGLKLLEVKTAVDSELRTVQAEQSAMQESVQKLNADLQRGADQLVVEEASQLLRLANNSVLFGGDVEAAMNALSLADAQLKGLRDPRYVAVRTQINSEIAALKNITLPDIEALSAQLNALTKGIAKLPLANEPESREIVATGAQTQEVDQPGETMTFRGELVKVWRDLIGSVSIQRVDQPPKPLLVPEQRYFLNENIGLSIAKAELALLQGQASIYQRSLNDARAWLRDYFDLSDSAVQNTLSQLDSLATQSVDAELPEITGSYQALQTILGGE